MARNIAKKLEDAEEDWQMKAKEIAEGRRESMLTILESRGYVNQIAGDRDYLDGLMNRKRIGAYVGIDPTAPSLHVGNLLPLMALFWMYINGFQAVTVLGGATAQIGDPTGRTKTRETVHSSIRKMNMAKMHFQLKKLWANMELYATQRHGYEKTWAWKRGLVNNNQWQNKLDVIKFLKLLGTGARVGTLLGRDTVKTKLEKGDGLSFAEFTYPLLQGWDWWQLFQTRRIQMQIGGADQFGNIITGIDAVNHVAKTQIDPRLEPEKTGPDAKPVAFTVPLLTTASGEKFGKSAGNAVWLDHEMTSTFDFYQFFYRSSDEDVGRYLRLFTLLPNEKIDAILEAHQQDQSKRIAQGVLAREVVEMVHGLAESEKAQAQHGLLFRQPKGIPNPSSKGLRVKDPTDINASTNKNVPQVNSTTQFPVSLVLPRSLIQNQSFPRVLYAAGLVASRSEGQRLCVNGGAYVGSQPGRQGGMRDGFEFVPIRPSTNEQTWDFVIDDHLLILRVGKWKLKTIQIVEDEEFKRRGLDAPGWKERLEEKYGAQPEEPKKKKQEPPLLFAAQRRAERRKKKLLKKRMKTEGLEKEFAFEEPSPSDLDRRVPMKEERWD